LFVLPTLKLWELPSDLAKSGRNLPPTPGRKLLFRDLGMPDTACGLVQIFDVTSIEGDRFHTSSSEQEPSMPPCPESTLLAVTPPNLLATTQSAGAGINLRAAPLRLPFPTGAFS
jgi:hypothetical protein